MDFMKVFDQTVREIKREVNLKVLKVPEIEQKVLDATNDEAWGPHGTALSEIAQATKKFTECQMIMNVLWNRLTDTGPNWRHVYKALTVIEYLLANGSERAVDDILEHISQISSISGFEYVEPNGKDDGVNVRKKVETILSLVSDREKIQAARDKAAANRDKYIGLSSTGMSYKPSSASYGSDSYYGSYRSSKEGESFKDSYKEGDQDGEDATSYRSKGGQSKSRETSNNISEGIKVKKGIGNRTRGQDSLPSSKFKTLNKPSPPHKSSSTQESSDDNDLDDFDPRGLSASGSAGANSNHVDLFGQTLVGDLLDASTSIPTPATAFNDAATTEVDLFADATFVSAPPQFEAASASHSQGNVDLFANQSVFNNAVGPNIDIFAAPVSGLPTAKESTQFKQTNTHAVDPFAAVPLNTFAESDSDLFGAFTSHSDPVTTDPSQKPSATNLNSLDQAPSTISKPAPKKDTFQVKSGIWADSLSRGLIDLNITAPKKVSLADIGIVGGLGDAFDEKEKGPPTSAYMGRAMGTGPGLGWSGVNYSASTAGGTGSTSNFGQQHQFGSFKS